MPSHFLLALFGPRLYRIFNQRPYEPNLMESSGDKFFAIGNCIYTVCIAISPLLVPYVLFNWTPASYNYAAKMTGTFYAIALLLRTCGRMANTNYTQFLDVLNKAKSNDFGACERLKMYDYQVYAGPVDFTAAPMGPKWFLQLGHDRESSNLGQSLNFARELVAWIAANTFGRRMLYPGSTALLHSLMNSQLIEGRRRLMEQKGGQRNTILTEDGNKLDTVFVDQRGQSEQGDTLVICCEGNAGFYEMGVMMTPLNLQYSVLGWNMPGFAESTGTPFPKAILYSMEAVMQFAINKLGFRPEQIVLYAWSIGGFPGTWAAANYPEIRGLILDASFDDLMPLALSRMPSAIGGLVRFTVTKYLNLPISKQLNQYNGPVLLIRRWNDEIITTDDSNSEKRRASNRANWLLLELLRKRYPGLIATDQDVKCIFKWLKRTPHERLLEYDPEDSMKPTVTGKDFRTLDLEQRHRLIRQLCSHYFLDFMDASHNVGLNPDYFNIPERID